MAVIYGLRKYPKTEISSWESQVVELYNCNMIIVQMVSINFYEAQRNRSVFTVGKLANINCLCQNLKYNQFVIAFSQRAITSECACWVCFHPGGNIAMCGLAEIIEKT